MEGNITITIEGVAPVVGSVEDTIGLNQRVREVKISAMGKMGLRPSEVDDYFLIFEDTTLREDQLIGEVLPEVITVGEGGLRQIATLQLAVGEHRGGPVPPPTI